MSAEALPAMRTSPKYIFFTDFDGNDYLTDTIGYGQEKRVQENRAVLDGKHTFRESFGQMMNSVTAPFNECIRLILSNIKLDPHFKEFFDWSQQKNIPIVVLSGGMLPIIEALLRNLIGPESEKIQIISNHVRTREGKTFDDEDGWDIVFRDDSEHGHDKSLTLRPYAQLPEDQRPVIFYAGDGVSDLSAARESDLLFAKEGKDLVTYCAREDIPFTTFEDWNAIKSTVEDVYYGRKSVKDAATDGFEKYKARQQGTNGSAK